MKSFACRRRQRTDNGRVPCDEFALAARLLPLTWRASGLRVALRRRSELHASPDVIRGGQQVSGDASDAGDTSVVKRVRGCHLQAPSGKRPAYALALHGAAGVSLPLAHFSQNGSPDCICQKTAEQNSQSQHTNRKMYHTDTKQERVNVI